jgi:hypothetical protein
MAIFDVFWKRDKPLPDVFQTQDIPPQLRVQVFWIWKETLKKFDVLHDFDAPPSNQYLHQIWEVICEEKGQHQLGFSRKNPEDDLAGALHNSDDTGLVLGIIELSFRFICLLQNQRFAPEQVEKAVSILNRRFREHGVGYQFDMNCQRLIPINSTFTYEEVIRPALAVLARKDFSTANDEFMAAWADFKKSDFDGSVLECGKAFESVMKIICDKKKWAVDPKATAKPLLETIIHNTGMETFFEQPLILIATLRNKLSAHGAGTAPTNVPEHIARYALNATASAVVLLVEAAGL